MHPYTGSLSLRFASYTKLFAVSALWLSATSYRKSQIMCACMFIDQNRKIEKKELIGSIGLLALV